MTILFLCGSYLLCSLPLRQAILWTQEWYRSKQPVDLQTKTEPIYFSLRGLIYTLTAVWDVVKGPLILLWADDLFFDTQITLLAALVIMIGHGWSCFQKFKINPHLFKVIWGVSGFFNPLFWGAYPLVFGILSLVLNSFYVAHLTTLFVGILAVAIFSLSLDLLPVIVGYFVITLFVYRPFLFGKSDSFWSLKKSFLNR